MCLIPCDITYLSADLLVSYNQLTIVLHVERGGCEFSKANKFRKVFFGNNMFGIKVFYGTTSFNGFCDIHQYFFGWIDYTNQSTKEKFWFSRTFLEYTLPFNLYFKLSTFTTPPAGSFPASLLLMAKS